MENSLNLAQEWQNMSAEIISKQQDNDPSTMLLDGQSHGLLQSLLFKLKWKLRWIRIIDIPLLIIAFFASGDLQIVLLVLFATYEIFRGLAIIEFNKIKTGVDYNANAKQLLTVNLKAIKSILKIENIYGYIFLPLSGPIGLLVYKLYAHQSFENIVIGANLFWQLGLLLIVGISLIYVTRKMNDSLFAQHIEDLKAKIAQLEN
ncbi:hypothetical protein [Pedobacter sp. Hv1]|uniref:hypothetical protein n=1 Tax=Pedobacter sp. Hv1 TaxID=1740090 RepID=UPI0006D8A5A1|nr:hypothetical protein [Pedobacter sp. Hv1]KQB99076.1 hypothetical protein AQF98_19180 [Pedobacter sp. Hv1]